MKTQTNTKIENGKFYNIETKEGILNWFIINQTEKAIHITDGIKIIPTLSNAIYHRKWLPKSKIISFKETEKLSYIKIENKYVALTEAEKYLIILNKLPLNKVLELRK